MSASLYCPLLWSHKAGFSLFNVSYFSDLNITVAYFKGISKPTVFLHRYLDYCLSSGCAGSSLAFPPDLFLPTYVAKSFFALIALLRAGWSRSLQRPVNFKGQALYINTPVAVCSPRSRLYPHHLPRIKEHKDQTCSPLGASGWCQPRFPPPSSFSEHPRAGSKTQSSTEGNRGPGGCQRPIDWLCWPMRCRQQGELMEEICLFKGAYVTALLPFQNQFSPRCWILREVVLLSAKPSSYINFFFFPMWFVRSHRDLIVSVATFVLAGQLRPFRWLGVTMRRFFSADKRLWNSNHLA